MQVMFNHDTKNQKYVIILYIVLYLVRIQENIDLDIAFLRITWRAYTRL